MKAIFLTSFILLLLNSQAVRHGETMDDHSTMTMPTTTTTTTTTTSTGMTGHDMGTGLTPQQSGNIDDLLASGAMGDETSIEKNITIHGLNLYAISILDMGLNHPNAMHVEHCRQVPYFVMPEERKDCIRATGYYYNMATRLCEPVTVWCNDIPTLNFWTTIDGCLANCTVDGKGLVWKNSPKFNLDPRDICTQTAYNPAVSTPKCSTTSKWNVVWTYDASINACYKVKIDCHWGLTNNSFAYNSTCQHMCHDVTFPGSGKGHRLFLPGETSNKTYNGVSLIINKEKIVGFSRDVSVRWETRLCRQIPFYITTKKASSKCTSTIGYYYDVALRKCVKTSMPCNGMATMNFWTDIKQCLSNCTVDGTGILFTKPRVNWDPRVICTKPVYDQNYPMKAECSTTSVMINVWTYDARTGVCGQAALDCHANLTENAFSSKTTCANMCARISPHNAGYGIFTFDSNYVSGSGTKPPEVDPFESMEHTH